MNLPSLVSDIMIKPTSRVQTRFHYTVYEPSEYFPSSSPSCLAYLLFSSLHSSILLYHPFICPSYCNYPPSNPHVTFLTLICFPHFSYIPYVSYLDMLPSFLLPRYVSYLDMLPSVLLYSLRFLSWYASLISPPSLRFLPWYASLSSPIFLTFLTLICFPHFSSLVTILTLICFPHFSHIPYVSYLDMLPSFFLYSLSHLQHRNTGTLRRESSAHDKRCTLVRAEYGPPTRSSNHIS
jgi:hypothetical protein